MVEFKIIAFELLVIRHCRANCMNSPYYWNIQEDVALSLRDVLTGTFKSVLQDCHLKIPLKL